MIALLAVASVTFAQDEPAPTPIAPGEQLSGTLADNTAFYSFQATANTAYVIDIASSDFEAAVTILDASGFPVTSSFSDEVVATLVFLAPESAEYQIEAGPFVGTATGDYTVRLSEGETIAPDTEVTGDISFGGAAATFEGPAGALISASFAVEGFDASYEIKDAEGNILTSGSSSFGGEPTVLEAVLPADGIYVMGVTYGFTDTYEGSYTISYSEIIPEPIEYDAPATVSIDGPNRAYYAFGGNAGDVIHITADSGSTDEAPGVDVDLEVAGPDGNDIFTDRSDGIGFDPAITRVILPEDGFYLIKVVPEDESDTAPSGDITLTVETAELITLDDGPVSITLGDEDRFEQDFVRFTGAPGASYMLTITPDRPTVSFTATLDNDRFILNAGVTVVDGDQASVVFTLPEDAEAGLVTLSLRQSAFQNTTTYEVSVEPMN